MSFAYRVSGTFLMDAGRRRLVQTEALLGCTIVRALRSPGFLRRRNGNFWLCGRGQIRLSCGRRFTSLWRSFSPYPMHCLGLLRMCSKPCSAFKPHYRLVTLSFDLTRCHCKPPKAAKQGKGEVSLAPTPCQGALPPGPPFTHPRGLRVCQGFGSHSWPGC